LDALLNFEPVKRFKNWRYKSEFGSFRDSSSSGIWKEFGAAIDDLVGIEEGRERGSCSNQVWGE